jgi:MFS family permease
VLDLIRKSYSGLSKDTWILAGVTLVNRSGMMVLPFMAIYLTSAKGFTVAQAGIISSFFGLGSMFGSYTGGQLSDRFGYFPVQLVSLIIGGIACILLAWIDGFYSLCTGMFVTSFLLDMLRPAMSSAVTSFATTDNRTRSFSLIRMAVNLGAGVGPAVAGILAGISFKLIFVGDGLTSVAAGIVLYLFFHSKIRKSSYRKSDNASASPLSDINFIWYIILCLCYATIFFQLFCTLPLYYDQIHHLKKMQTGYLIAMNGLIVFTFEMMLVF